MLLLGRGADCRAKILDRRWCSLNHAYVGPGRLFVAAGERNDASVRAGTAHLGGKLWARDPRQPVVGHDHIGVQTGGGLERRFTAGSRFDSFDSGFGFEHHLQRKSESTVVFND